MIYLDHCASTPMSKAAAEKLCELAKGDLYANAGAAHHEAGEKVARLIKESREGIALRFGVPSDQVFFNSGATEANNLIIGGFALANMGLGARLLIGATEHAAVLECALAASSRFAASVRAADNSRATAS